MSERAKTFVQWMLGAAIFLTLFYAFTGIVRYEGGFTQSFVIKPEPGLGWFFGGGEEGSWQRAHPGEPLPWWMTRHFLVLFDDDWEGGRPWWETPYSLGILLTPILWGASLLVGLFAQLHHSNRQR